MKNGGECCENMMDLCVLFVGSRISVFYGVGCNEVCNIFSGFLLPCLKTVVVLLKC